MSQPVSLKKIYEGLFYTLCRINKEKEKIDQEICLLESKLQGKKDTIHASYIQKKDDIDRNIDKVTGYLDKAKRKTSYYTECGSLQPPDYAMLSQLTLSININSDEDSAARELARRANGMIAYLNSAKNTLAYSEQKEKTQAESDTDRGKRALLQKRDSLEKDLRDLIYSADLELLRRTQQSELNDFFVRTTECYDLEVPTSTKDVFKFGVTNRPFYAGDKYDPVFTSRFGSDKYDTKKHIFHLPIGTLSNSPQKMQLLYPGSEQDRISRIIQGFIFNIMRSYVPMPGRVTVIDFVTRNPTSLGAMSVFASDTGFITFASNDAEAAPALNNLIHRKQSDNELRYLFIRGYPEYYSEKIKEDIRNICINYKSYHVSVIETETLERQTNDVKDLQAISGCSTVKYDGQSTYIKLPHDADWQSFNWFGAPKMLSSETVSRFKTAYIPKTASNRLFDVYPLPSSIPQYKRGRGRKNLRIPIGVSDDETCVLEINDKNSFGYLFAPAGSGKTSLLHIIIANIIMNYHPDDVELWLADFARVGFVRYANSGLPHVKYLLLDDLQLYSFSFIDRLTDELKRRQKLFLELNKKYGVNFEKITDIPEEIYLPVILVIIDEFKKLNDLIVGTPYADKLCNIINQGRKFGIRILFSSQGYQGHNTSIASASQNLTFRLAMQTTEDKKIGLALDNITSEEDSLIKSLGEHQTLYRSTDNGKRLRKADNYFIDDSELKKLDQAMLRMSKAMKKESGVDIGEKIPFVNIESYIDKKSSFIDGVTRSEYSSHESAFKEASTNHFEKISAMDGDLLLFPGDPCDFGSVRPIILQKTDAENVLFFCDYMDPEMEENFEKFCDVSADLLLSAESSGSSAEVWALKNNVCIKNMSSYWKSFESRSVSRELCDYIHELHTKKINGETINKTIFIISANDVLSALARQNQTVSSSSATQSSPLSIADQMNQMILKMESGGDSGNSAKPADELVDLIQSGGSSGLHFIANFDSILDLKNLHLNEYDFRHIFTFRLANDDTYNSLGNYSSAAKSLPDGVFLYSDRKRIRKYVPYTNNALNKIQGKGD